MGFNWVYIMGFNGNIMRICVYIYIMDYNWIFPLGQTSIAIEMTIFTVVTM